MPHHRTLRSLFVELLIFVGMFTFVGHLSMNFWERFIIQNELSSMKTSLHSLKETINKIGYAYDNLQRELTGLAEKAEQKQSAAVIKNEAQAPQSNKDVVLNKRAIHHIPVQATIKAKNHTTITVPLLINKNVQNSVFDITDKTTQYFVPEKKKVLKNITTITRNPPKSTGVGSDVQRGKTEYNDHDCKYKTTLDNQYHKCREEYECDFYYDKWNFRTCMNQPT